MEAANLDIMRGEKMHLIHGSMEALSSLTFCVDYRARPNNCGRCSKCVRTKAMLLPSVGVVPDVFLDKAFIADMLNVISPRKK
jgi:hypothetical protein